MNAAAGKSDLQIQNQDDDQSEDDGIEPEIEDHVGHASASAASIPHRSHNSSLNNKNKNRTMEDTRSQDHHMDDKEMYMDIEDEQIGVENQSAL